MKVAVFAYICIVAIGIILIFACSANILVSFLRKRNIYTKSTYSFDWINSFFVYALLIATAMSLFLYHSTGSFEIMISFYVFMLVCIIAGIARSSLIEYHAKKRGASKKSRESQ